MHGMKYAFLIFIMMLLFASIHTTKGQCKLTEEQFIVHIVTQGDTLYDIANYHGTSIASIVEANCLSDMHLIYVGQALRVPLETDSHTVAELNAAVNNVVKIRGTGIVTAQVLKVRLEPGIHAAVVTYVRHGESYQVIGQLEDRSWLQIQLEDHVGWVNARYVNHSKG